MTGGTEFREHWRTLLGCFLAASINTIGLHAYTSGAFLNPLEVEAGFSREQISIATLLLAVTVALVVPFAGAFMDRVGPLRLIAPCVLGEAAAFGLLSVIPADYGYYALGIILLGLLGVGTAPLGFARLITARFDKARGLALALMIAGVAMIAVAGPLVATWTIGEYGWRGGYRGLAILVLALGGVGTLLIFSDRRKAPAPARASHRAAGDWSALRRPLFYLMWMGFFAPSLFGAGYLLHLITILRDRGFTAEDAAGVQSMVGIAVLSGRLLSGIALDHFKAQRVAALIFTISGIGCALLMIHDVTTAHIAALCIGLTIGAEPDVMAYFFSRYFPLASFTRLYGIAYGGLIVGGGLSPVLISYLADARDYSLPLMVTAIGTTASALILLNLPDPDPRLRAAAGEAGV